MTGSITPVNPQSGLNTRMIPQYSDSTTEINAPFSVHDSAYVEDLLLKATYGGTTVELLPTYADNLIKLHIETQSDQLSVLELELVDDYGSIEAENILYKGTVLSLAADYATERGTSGRYNIGVYRISEITTQDGVISISAENIVAVLDDYTCKGTAINANNPIMAQLETLLASYDIPYIASACQTTAEGAITLPNISVWQMCQYLDAYLTYRAKPLPNGYRVAINRAGQIECKDQGTNYRHYTWAVSYNQEITNIELLTDVEIAEKAPYNYVVAPYSADYAEILDYRDTDETARIFTYDNPLIITEPATGDAQYIHPAEIVNDTYTITIKAQLPLFYRIGDNINILDDDGQTIISGAINGLSYDFEGGDFYAIISFTKKEYAPVSEGRKALDPRDKLGGQAAAVQQLIDEGGGGSVLESVYPIGSVYINASNSANPSVLLGFGSWASLGAGRCLMGVDTSQTEFNTVGKTGGEKTHTLSVGEMPSHTHTQNAHSHGIQNGGAGTVDVGAFISEYGSGATGAIVENKSGVLTNTTMSEKDNTVASSGSSNKSYMVKLNISSHSHIADNATATNQNTGGNGAHNNLAPYITVYMWKRTA